MTILDLPQLTQGAKISNVAYSSVKNGTLFFTTSVWSNGSGVFTYHIETKKLTQIVGNGDRAGNNSDCGLDPDLSQFSNFHRAPGTLGSTLEVISEDDVLISSNPPSVHLYQLSTTAKEVLGNDDEVKTQILPIVTNGPGCRYDTYDPTFQPGTPTWSVQIGTVDHTLLLEGSMVDGRDPELLFTQYAFIGSIKKNLFNEWLGKQGSLLEYNDTSVSEYVDRSAALTKAPRQIVRFVNSSGEEHVIFGDSSGLVRAVHLATDTVFPLVGATNSSWPPKNCSHSDPCTVNDVYLFRVTGLAAFNATSLFIADGTMGVIYFANLETGLVRSIAGQVLEPFTRPGPPGTSRVAFVRSLSLSPTHLYFTSGRRIGALELPPSVRLSKLPTRICSVAQHCSNKAYWVEGNPATGCNCTCYRGFSGDQCENRVGPFTASRVPTSSMVPTQSREIPHHTPTNQLLTRTNHFITSTVPVVEEPLLCQELFPSGPAAKGDPVTVTTFQELGVTATLNLTGLDLVEGLLPTDLYQVQAISGEEDKKVPLNATILQFESNSTLNIVIPPPSTSLEPPATIQVLLEPQWFFSEEDRRRGTQSECVEVNVSTVIFSWDITVPEPGSSQVAQDAAEVVVPAVTALGTLASSAGAVDMQSLVIIGMMSCAQPGQKKISESNQRALSPIAFSNTHAGILFGNIALVFIVALLHVFITAMWAQWKGKPFNKATIDLGFPNYSLRALFFVFQGTAIAGLNLLRPRDDGRTLVQDILFGVFGVLCSISIPVFFVVYTRKVVSARFGVYDPIIMNQRYNSFLVKYILPWGQWTPRNARKKYGALFSSIASNKRIWSCASLISPTILVIGTVIRPATSGGCVAQYAVLAAIEMIWGIFIIAVQPLRSHAMTLCWGLSIIFLGVVLAGTGAAANDPTGPGASVAFVATLIQLFFSLVRTIISIGLTLFERRKLSTIGTKTVFVWRVAGEDVDLVDDERADADNNLGEDPFGLSEEMLSERTMAEECENDGTGTPHPDQRVANASLAAIPTGAAMTASFANNNSVLSKLSTSPTGGAHPAPTPAPAAQGAVPPPQRQTTTEDDCLDDDLAAFL